MIATDVILAALGLRADKKSWRQIAAHLDVPETSLRRAVEEYQYASLYAANAARQAKGVLESTTAAPMDRMRGDVGLMATGVGVRSTCGGV